MTRECLALRTAWMAVFPYLLKFLMVQGGKLPTAKIETGSQNSVRAKDKQEI
jgi:hypothetical protein